MMKLLQIVFLWLTLTVVVSAQPNDQRILQDIRQSEPGAFSIKFNGSLLETNDGAYYVWSQPVICTTKTDLSAKYPNAKLVKYGAVVYYKMTNGSFQFKHFSVPEGYTGYIGIPGPSEAEIQSWIDRNGGQPAILGGSSNRIVQVHKFKIIPKFWIDYQLTNYAFDIEAEYDEVGWATNVMTVHVKFNVDIRKLETGKWFDHISSVTESSTTVKERKITKDEEAKLLQSNIVAKNSEAAANAVLAKLPKVDIPVFETPFHMIVHLMDFLRTADYYRMQAYLYKVMAPRCFVEGSKTQLTREGQDMMNHLLNVVQNKKIKFGEFYCDDPPMSEYANNDDVKELRFLGKLANYKSRIQVTRSGGVFKEGVKTGGEWKLYYAEIKLPSNDDEIAKLKSYSDPSQFCNFTDKQSVKKFVGIVPDPLAKATTNVKPKTSTWKPYTSALGNFSIQFPGEVTEKINPTGKVTYYNYTASAADGALYAVSSVKLGRKMTDPETITMGQNFLKSFIGNEKLISQSAYKRGQGGLEAIILQKETYDVRYVVFVEGEYVFQIYITSNKGLRIEANENQFLNSFGFVNAGR